MFPVVVQHFNWKNGGLQSKLIEVLQQSNGAARTVAQYIKGTLENCVFFNLKNNLVFDYLLLLSASSYLNGSESLKIYIF
jgi:hypothetical protein